MPFYAITYPNDTQRAQRAQARRLHGRLRAPGLQDETMHKCTIPHSRFVPCSAEVGVEKPNPVIFETACERLGCRPVETVHVGDDRRRAARVPVRHLKAELSG